MPYLTKAPQQEESSDFIKKLYVCPTRGCGAMMESDRKHCADCSKVEVRKEIEAEWDKNSPKQ